MLESPDYLKILERLFKLDVFELGTEENLLQELEETELKFSHAQFRHRLSQLYAAGLTERSQIYTNGSRGYYEHAPAEAGPTAPGWSLSSLGREALCQINGEEFGEQ